MKVCKNYQRLKPFQFVCKQQQFAQAEVELLSYTLIEKFWRRSLQVFQLNNKSTIIFSEATTNKYKNVYIIFISNITSQEPAL